MEKAPKYTIDVVRVMLVREARGRYRAKPATDSKEAWELIRERLGASAAEKVVVLNLDARNRAVSIAEVASGTVNACLVHPREIFAPAILSNALAVIVAHNHPSGNTEPSDEDRKLRDRLDDSGAVLGIPLLDFLIVTDTEFLSLGSSSYGSRVC